MNKPHTHVHVHVQVIEASPSADAHETTVQVDPSQTPATPDAASRARLLAKISGSERYTLFAPDVARAFGLNVDDARMALRLIQDPSAWQQSAVASISVLSTPALAKLDVVIARLAVAVRIAKHPHSAREITLVLDGALIENGDNLHQAGDLLDMPTGSEHEIAVAGEHACLAVFHPARV